ncbi:hypothetical protein [Paenibacillus lactis]|uniref:hypothetical protein n=1 Tax=Paenibacillus lactis TaxID=228574 RepID=UPI003D719005
MSRDWQKDMELCKQTDGNSPWSRELLMAEQPDITIYWLQQYAEWKAKAYEAEVKAAAEKERADRLHNAIEKAVSQSWGVKMLDLLDIKKELQASLYPKEETKPAVLEDDDIVKSMNAGPIPFGLEEEETK